MPSQKSAALEAVGVRVMPSATGSCGARSGPFTRTLGDLRGASGACRAGGPGMSGESQTGGSSDARDGLGRGEPTPRHGHYAGGPESSCGPGPGRTPVPGRCAGPHLGGRHHLRADLGRVRVPSHGARRVQPPGGGMVDGPPSSYPTGARGAQQVTETPFRFSCWLRRTPPTWDAPGIRPGSAPSPRGAW